MMKLICSALGALLCVTAVIGFINHEALGMALNPVHDAFLLVMGVVSMYFGITGTEFQARYMCRTLGFLFTVLGAATLFAPAGVATPGDVNIEATHVLKLIPGALEYTTADGIRDLITGIVGLCAGFFPRYQEIKIDTAAQEAALKAQKQVASKK